MPDRLPVLALVANPGEGAALRPLVRALSASVTLRALRATTPTPDAVLATSPDALGGAANWRGPTAVWIGDHQQLEAFRDLPASVPHTVVTPLPEAAHAARASGAQALEVNLRLGLHEELRWQPPLLRARWRAREGLAAHLVVVVLAAAGDGAGTARDGDRGGRDAVSPTGTSTVRGTGEAASEVEVRRVSSDDPALASLLLRASAAVVAGTHLPRAVGTGCPVVTTTAAATALGLTGGVHVLVEDDAGDAVAAAVALATDLPRASRLSRAAATAGSQASATRAATKLLDLLGLDGPGAGPWQRAIDRLEEIELPTGGPFRLRVLDALQPFAPTGGPAS